MTAPTWVPSPCSKVVSDSATTTSPPCSSEQTVHQEQQQCHSAQQQQQRQQQQQQQQGQLEQQQQQQQQQLVHQNHAEARLRRQGLGRELTAGSVSASSAVSSCMGSTSAAAGMNRLPYAGEGHGSDAEMPSGSSEGQSKLVQGGASDAVLGIQLDRAAGVQVCLLIIPWCHTLHVCVWIRSCYMLHLSVYQWCYTICMYMCVCSGGKVRGEACNPRPDHHL